MALAAWTLSAGALFGWNEQGHRVVARAAQEQLSENAVRRMSYLFGKEAKLVDMATWADEIAGERPDTEAWHSITVPPDATSVDLKRDCPLGECVTAKVRECIGILRLAIKPRSEIVDAFKMLVGLAADMHQPLLNGLPPGRGKEDSVVIFSGKEMSLFEALDSGLIQRMGSEDQVLDRVRRHIQAADREAWTTGTYRAWTWETHKVATDQIYAMVGEANAKTEMNGPTLREAEEIIVDRLAKSAVRLAYMLDVAWP